MDLTKLRTWLLGGIGAAINSAAGAGTLVIIKPEDFNPFSGGDVYDLLKVTAAFAITGFYLYVQTHPVQLCEDKKVTLT